MATARQQRQAARKRERYATDPSYRAKKLEANRVYRRANRARRREYERAYWAKRLERKHEITRAAGLRGRYGLSVEDYDAMLEVQGGVCAICGLAEARLVVDHDHATGANRGILCDPCNRGLGAFRDDPKKLRRAADYLAARDIVPFGSGGGRRRGSP